MWGNESLENVKKYYETRLEELEEELDTSDYPPGVQKEIDSAQDIIWLVSDMMNEKSWIYRHCNKK